jgi:glutathione S-transferase
MPPSLVLYGNKPLTSPYVFSVFVTLKEKDLPFTLEQIDLAAGEQNEARYTAQGLTNRVPALQHDDFWLAESSAITEYLEEAFPPPSYVALYPPEIRARARVRLVQALLRSDFLAIRDERPTSTIFGPAKRTPLSPKGTKEAARLIRIASTLLAEHGKNLTGSFTIADADLALMLQRLIANGDPVPDALASFVEAVWARPSVQAFLALAPRRR